MAINVADLRPETTSAADRRAALWRYWVGPLTAFFDMISVMAVVIIASAAYHGLAYGHGGDGPLTFELATVLGAIFVFTNTMRRRYELANYLSRKGQMLDAFNVWNVTMVAFIAIGFMAKVIDNYSRAVVALSYLVGIPVIALMRNVVVGGISRASKLGRITTERVLVIGRDADVMSFVSRHQPWNMGFAIVDAVFLRESDRDLDEDLTRALARIRDLEPDAVFLALPWAARRRIERCIDALMTTPVAIHLAPEQIMDRFENPHIARIGAMTTLELTRPPLSTTEVALKRAFDLVGALAILFVSAPMLLAIALAVRLSGGGSVLFAQRRYGFNQQEFRIYKFRTMTVSEDGDKVSQAVQGDARITRVGRFLRRFNLDELPQLLNVIRGEMSLVGPRPHALAHDRDYARRISLYARRHNVKPGITGWAQVNGFRGLTDTDEKMARRIDHDLWYIDNWSFWLDVVIMLRTVFSPKAFRNAH